METVQKLVGAENVLKLQSALDTTKAALAASRVGISNNQRVIDGLVARLRAIEGQPVAGGPVRMVAPGAEFGAPPSSDDAVLQAYDTLAKVSSGEERMRIISQKLAFMRSR